MLSNKVIVEKIWLDLKEFKEVFLNSSTRFSIFDTNQFELNFKKEFKYFVKLKFVEKFCKFFKWSICLIFY